MTASKHIFDLDLFYSAISGFALVSRQLFPYGRHRATIRRTGWNQPAISMDVGLMNFGEDLHIIQSRGNYALVAIRNTYALSIAPRSRWANTYIKLHELIVYPHETGITRKLADQR